MDIMTRLIDEYNEARKIEAVAKLEKNKIEERVQQHAAFLISKLIDEWKVDGMDNIQVTQKTLRVFDEDKFEFTEITIKQLKNN